MKFYQSKLLKRFSDIRHCYTTKHSGNVAFHVNDDKERVIANHKRLAQELHYDYKSLAHMKQVHSNAVKIITKKENFDAPPTCDALITNQKNIPLMIMVADCAPLLFFDTEKKSIAVAHAGRAGAFSNIIQNVIDVFVKDFHSKLENIYVSVGPSIGECCYEVGEEIVKEAKELGLEYAVAKRANHYFLNIRKILQTQLLNAGVQKENIEISPLCNACHTEDFYSYRVEKETGRFSGVILLRE